ncbi:Putative zinc finger in N-recognin (UBR box), putative [Angomonas deanei]|uniref:E3 ubiquitin-protein ligase n=1 Tax=Angomonas deanei TaxID=59799 RepID=A0A7G2CM93_9TRYP|nr:Putative zinc finger in N-recognin (UBR box), putative [Angomonas deanei]
MPIELSSLLGSSEVQLLLARALQEDAGALRSFIGTLHPEGRGEVLRKLQATLFDSRMQPSFTADTSSVCGHIFADNEVVMRCSECSADPTCVMCTTCFQNSPCVNHHYTMHRGSGGGMCDCGDPTAYKAESFCTRHKAGDSDADPLATVAAETLQWFRPALEAYVTLCVSVMADKDELKQRPGLQGSYEELASSSSSEEEEVEEETPADEEAPSQGETAPAPPVKSEVIPHLQSLVSFSTWGDSAKRLLSLSWSAESLRGTETNIERAMLFTTCLSKGDARLEALRPAFQCILCDGTFRLPFAAVLCKYGELFARFPYYTDHAVQVFTNPDVIQSLCTSPQTHLQSQTDSMVHRLLLSIYAILHQTRRSENLQEDPLHEVRAELFQMVPVYRKGVIGPLIDLGHAVVAQDAVPFSLLASRTALRGLMTILQIVTCSTDVVGVESPDVRYIPLPCFFSYHVPKVLLNMQRALLSILSHRREHTEDGREASLQRLEIPQGLLERLGSSRNFDNPLPVTHFEKEFEPFNQSTQLSEDEDGLLFPRDSSEAETFRYIHDILGEWVRGLEPVLQFQRERLCRGNMSIVLKRTAADGGGEVYAYDTFSPCSHSVLMLHHVAWWGATVLRAVVRGMGTAGEAGSRRLYPEGVNLSELQDVVVSSAVTTDENPLYRVMRSCFDGNAAMVEELLDALVMPCVMEEQVRQGMWRTVDADFINLVVGVFSSKKVKCFKGNTLFMLQALTMVIKPQDFALRVLQRFSYCKPPEEEEKKGTKSKLRKTEKRSGIAPFLRLILTIVTHSATTGVKGDYCEEGITREVVNLLSIIGRGTFSSIRSVFEDFGVEDDFTMLVAKGVEDRLKTVLKETTVQSKAANGRVHRLKSTAVYKEFVDLYSLSHHDQLLTEVATVYGSLVAGEAAAKGDSSNTVSRAVPPTQIRDKFFYRELIPHTRALLHADAVQLPAMYLLATQLVSAKGSGGVSPASLLHSVTALYLATKDCVALSSELSIGEATEKEGAPAVQWTEVEKYLSAQGVLHCSYDTATSKEYLLLPQLAGGTVRQKLQTKVNFQGYVDGWTPALSAVTTVSDVLHELRQYFQSNKNEDKFSILVMVEYILLTCQVATFTPEQTAEEVAAAAEAQQQAQRRKDRQRELMLRMRSRAERGTHAETVDEGKPVSGEERFSANLQTHLLVESTSQDCCVCRVSSVEPLYLLCNVSSSDVLRRLQPDAVPDQRIVHAHYYNCGHVAHKKCIDKLIYLNIRNHYRRHAVTEIPCSVCKMICNALCPLPQLNNDTGNAVPGLTSLEDIRNCTFDNAEVPAEASALHSSLANACVGVSLESDAPPLVAPEQEDELQKNNVPAWGMSETLRTVTHHLLLLVEQVRTGQPILYRDLLSLFSLLVSLRPGVLRPEEEALRRNFERTKEVLPSLLLDCLLSPEKTHETVGNHIKDVITSDPATRDAVLTFLSEGEAPITSRVHSTWYYCSVLTLAQLLLADDPTDAVVRLSGDSADVELLTVCPSALASPAAMREALFVMLPYLLHTPAENVLPTLREAPTPTAAHLLRVSDAPFESCTQWVDYVWTEQLHLPKAFLSILNATATAARTATGRNQVLCCGCGQLYPFADGKLHEHIRQCFGVTALFCDVTDSSLFLINALLGQMTVVTGLYVDENDEIDRQLRRGRPLFRSSEEELSLLKVWLRNLWSVESKLNRQTTFIMMERV